MWDVLLDKKGLRSSSVTGAAVLGVLGGVMALVISATLFDTLLGPVGAAAWIVALVWGIALTQLVGAVLLIVGAVRLAMGAGRWMLVVGAAMQVLVSALILLFGLTVAANDSDEPGTTVLAFAVVAVVFAGVPVTGVVMAVRPSTPR